MRVILQHNVQNLGSAGQVVEAKPGYFRNYLEPRNLATKATPGALKRLEQDLEVMRVKAQEAYEAKLLLAKKIEEVGSITLKAKSGENGKLFGKVTNKEIVEELSSKAGNVFDKKMLKLSESISYLGTYKAKMRLAHDIETEFSVLVVEENK